jgi:long-chain-fatty-acid--[acyl-carrier-protein] ligase
VTFCKENRPPVGVGPPLSNLELCAIHPETYVLLPKGTQGEICIHGDSVFKGYLGNVAKDPFIEIQGKKWYRSGDLGHVDEEGNLILGGRLKRFVKVGGEMISLNALEEELMVMAYKNHWVTDAVEGPILSIGIKDTLDRPAIVLFTTFSVTKDQVNMALRESGFGRIMKITEVKQLKTIPMTGAGKVHYRRLNELATA